MIQGIGFMALLILAAAADSFVDLYGFISYAAAMFLVGAMIVLPDKLRR